MGSRQHWEEGRGFPQTPCPTFHITVSPAKGYLCCMNLCYMSLSPSLHWGICCHQGSRLWLFLIGGLSYPIDVLICISMMTRDMDLLFFAAYMPSLVRCLLRYLVCFFIGYFSSCWILEAVCIFWRPVLYQICLLKIFSPNLWLIFSFFWHCLHRVEILNFNDIRFIFSFFRGSCLWGCL